MSQRELVRTMSVEEIIDWMAYETSLSTEFREKLANTPRKLSAEEESDAIRLMFSSLGQPQE